ncbi:ABC transporter ATP-binding protein [Pseudonocardia sp. KRD-184]|uniref:ABC transporter ATP-binding protein n=1 Tax=Pseudonocardia oceani TaxID=2792013 RepID=A0ABS6U4Z2_9PSEU|nr:ABC transporter ATP-binding protein [Pseudonocardia oceani]MBW0089862.1 ABC transporter ATP-binding protein [Pseudonocardia oceani]MBW0097446.1 ABC transporter ATP-binding protein [Pseudonocardia oceani]MBW0123774.1 ABC transporter ATP-binding protein [Pseudonocardia oceani]MBW0127061.1 ABC transporter ATP-binding protein [Pseudonocardia oceani]
MSADGVREPAAAAIACAGLTSYYGQAPALRGVDVAVHTDEIVAVLGHNGAGKSTLLRSLARVHRAVDGAVTVSGREVTAEGASSVARLGVSLVREGAPVFGDLTVEENLLLGARLARVRGRQAPDLDEVWTWFAVLGERRSTRAGLLSGGQRQMLAISTALVSRPTVLLVDEPSAGLAPAMAETVFTAIRQLCATGMAVLLAEQNMRWVSDFATRTYHLETGTIAGSVTAA